MLNFLLFQFISMNGKETIASGVHFYVKSNIARTCALSSAISSISSKL
jgi:hypothetical protein